MPAAFIELHRTSKLNECDYLPHTLFQLMIYNHRNENKLLEGLLLTLHYFAVIFSRDFVFLWLMFERVAPFHSFSL